ncbi:MAG: 3-deoxy-manno-octulosonate cytidylyltransferase [Acidimicrobiia bacterium]
MTAPRVLVVVPARMASSRFPGKPLVSIGGLPMIEHIRRRAALAAGITEVIVATCDDAIRHEVEAAGGRVAMTSSSHERCTERVEEAVRTEDADIVIIVQGDEPLLLPEFVEQVMRPVVDDATTGITNLVSPLDQAADATNPNIVKAACDTRGDILFFSRAPIPYYQRPADCPVYRQTGIMAFRSELLRHYVSLPATPFERAEGIDMMRLLEHGLPVRAVLASTGTVGVDRPDDVALVETALRDDARQRELHQLISSNSGQGQR